MDASVIVLAFGEEPWLHESVASALASTDVEVEVVVVDNGAAPTSIASVEQLPGVTVVRPGANLGFAGGVNRGVASSKGEVIVLLNSDAFVAPDTIAKLATRVRARDGIAGALILLADEPEVINSAGNPLHILGLSWAGMLGRPRSEVRPGAVVTSASGACLALTRAHWDRLGGFNESYFAYLEDMDLSWRTHQHGLPVSVLTDAACWHHYEYGRSEIKNYLLERNRLLFLLTNHEARTLAVLALPLAALEVAMLALALSQGWGRQKVAGWGWLARHPRTIVDARRRIQDARVVPDAALLSLLTTQFTAEQEEMPNAARPLEGVLRGYWKIAKPLIRPRLRRSVLRARSTSTTGSHPTGNGVRTAQQTA